MRGGENMNISKVYYEELRSKCVNGKWESKRIGAEVKVDDGVSDNTYYFNYVKTYVQNKLDAEMGDVKKVEELRKTLDEIRQIAKTII